MDDVVVVDEEEIVRAIFFLMESEKMVVEGGGAVGVAAILGEKVGLGPADVTVCVLSGGNIDMNPGLDDHRPRAVGGRAPCAPVGGGAGPAGLPERGHRSCRDPRGQRAPHRTHPRAFGDISEGHVSIEMEIETRGREHVAEIVAELRELGHQVGEVS